MANLEKQIPQVGIGPNGAEESDSASPLCPSYSGGGANCHEDYGLLKGKEKKKGKKKQKGKGKEKEMEVDTLASELDASDSDASVQTVDSARSTESGSLWSCRKGKRRHEDVSASSSDGKERSVKAFKAPNPVDVLNASLSGRRQNFLRREAASLEAEKCLEEQASDASANRVALGLQVTEEGDTRTAVALNKQVLDDVAIILKVATSSKNLKGTYTKALKESAASIKAVVDVLQKRTTSEEVEKLQADNVRLQNEVSQLQKDMVELRAEMIQAQRAPAPSSPRRPSPHRMEVVQLLSSQGGGSVEELTRSIMLQVGGMLSARLEGLEERLLPDKRLRPPLAADQRRGALDARETEGSANTSGPQTQKSKKGKVTPKTTDVRPPERRPKQVGTNTPFAAAPAAVEEGWSAVVRRGGRKKEAPQRPAEKTTTATKPKSRSSKIKLRTPRSAAVVISLQPGAEEKGVTYAKVLEEARNKIDLASCGITSLRFRQAATGARMLEVPGATSGEKADTLAQKLREALNAEMVKISRPTKCAEMRISGLDDSVSVRDLASAIVERGCCPEESVKIGEIRRDSQGVGAVLVRCPVTAAKKLEAGGRLLVGWVAAQVRVLQPRPMQCYRCLQKGHVRAQCTAEVDRSDECYRCGRPGHKAAMCSAEPKCSLCLAANKPAGHRLGSKSCCPPKQNKVRAKATGNAVVPVATSRPLSLPGNEEAMEINQLVS